MKIVLNAIIAKRATTGGFQVTKNFFYRTREDSQNEWFYFVSEELDTEIQGLIKGVDNKHYFVFPTQPNIKSYWSVRSRLKDIESLIRPDVIYSILAPCYFRFKAPEVMRCANAWSVVGGVNKYVLKVVPFKIRWNYYFKSRITQRLMRNTRFFITQSEIAKHCIMRTVGAKSDNVQVVTNVLPVKYQKSDTTKVSHVGFNIVYVAAPANHKDILLLPEVASVLIERYKLACFKFHVTIPLNNTTFLNLFNGLLLKYGVSDVFINHGYQTQDDLIKLYPKCDLGVFPSLLETFSATLLEYMHFQLPIVSSDLDFNREVASNAALYFKPHCAEDCADKIYQVYTDANVRNVLLENAKARLAMYSNNADKYSETVDFLKYAADQSKDR